MNEEIRLALSRSDLSNKEKILIILFSTSNTPVSVSGITKIALSVGLLEAQNWNISYLLRSSKPLTTKIKEGWILSSQGKEYIRSSGWIEKKTTSQKVISDLRKHIVSINNQEVISFLEEAILCFEYKVYRAATVLSWVGSIAILYDYVVKNKLSSFNAEALRRDTKWKEAKTADDLSRMKEFDFLNILEAISIIGRNVKQELQKCLQLRNSCGHPNSLVVGENMVAAHIEVLILNVFSKFI